MNQMTSYRIKQKAASMLMLVALAWLTVSQPFVFSFQLEQKEWAHHQETQPLTERGEDASPLDNTPEEKGESGENQLSEFLHDTFINLHPFSTSTSFYKCHKCNLHLDIYPEFFSPPPEVAIA